MFRLKYLQVFTVGLTLLTLNLGTLCAETAADLNTIQLVGEYYRNLMSAVTAYRVTYEDREFPNEDALSAVFREAETAGNEVPGVALRIWGEKRLRKIELTISGPCYFQRSSKYDFSDAQLTTPAEVYEYSFDGQTAYYYHPTEKTGTIWDGGKFGSASENPWNLYLLPARVLSNYGNRITSVIRKESSQPGMNIVEVRFSLSKEEAVAGCQGIVITCDLNSNFRILQYEEWLKGEWPQGGVWPAPQRAFIFDDHRQVASAGATFEVPYKVRVKGSFLSTNQNIEEQEIRVVEFSIPIEILQGFKMAFPVGTKVWVKNINLSYIEGEY